MDKLCDLNFLQLTTHRNDQKNNSFRGATYFVSPSESLYEFDTTFIRLCIYNLIPHSMKQKYHRKIARGYEGAFSDDLEPLFPILAFHYNNAGDFDKAFKCYELVSLLQQRFTIISLSRVFVVSSFLFKELQVESHHWLATSHHKLNHLFLFWSFILASCSLYYNYI
jgi:hypothetical protein